MSIFSKEGGDRRQEGRKIQRKTLKEGLQKELDRERQKEKRRGHEKAGEIERMEKRSWGEGHQLCREQKHHRKKEARSAQRTCQ